MDQESFAKALNRLLKLSGHFAGMTAWFNGSIGLDPRYLRRWRNEGKLPSVRDWNHFETKVKEEFKGNPEVLTELRRLREVWEYHHGRVSNLRSAANSDDHRPEPVGNCTASLSQRFTISSPEELFARFVADTRIAAQLPSGPGTKSVYLDTVYVHRGEPEKKVFEIVRQYLSSSDEPHGAWISVVGDAGHGKTSFLWCVVQECRRLCPRLFPVQALQLNPNALTQYAQSLKGSEGPFVFVLDTLDLLVGIDDESLGDILNTLRANGGLVITTCRKQEIQALARRVHLDQTINLERYAPEEAKTAIEHYVGAFYAAWADRKRQAQINYVWNLLDAQRKIQDLNFEPLVMRMIFEAYAPNAIPPDINTQKVYDHFWEERVLGDRAAKSPESAHVRAALCLRLASHLYFETESHSERTWISAFIEHYDSSGLSGALPVIHGLVSSGVLRWWQMKASVGFFHQTFLEYTAARSLLETDDIALRQRRIDSLLADVERANLFRVPVLKQLMIQASGTNAVLFDSLCAEVAEINTPVAVRLALEVLGKARDTSDLHHRILRWNAAQPKLFRAVAPEVLRYYPASRVDLALEILAPHMSGEAIGEICYSCATFFAPMAPSITLRFLEGLWQSNSKIFKEHEASLKSSLVAVFRSGGTAALDTLAEILPSLSVGVQAGALEDLGALWTRETASAGAIFLGRMFPRLVKQESNEPRAAFVKAFDSLYAVLPREANLLVRTLQSRFGASRDAKTTLLLARLIGIADPEPNVLKSALNELLGTNHETRLRACYLLREAARTTPEVVDNLLSLPADCEIGEEGINVIYSVAAGSRDANRLLAVLDRWDPTERGAGTAYRVLMESAAKADPVRTLCWLRTRVHPAKTAARRRQILVGFQVVAEHGTNAVSVDDARLFYQLGFLSADATDEMKRVFAGAAGWIAEIDAALGLEVFERVFRSRKRESINAAIGSLRTIGSPELAVAVCELTRRFATNQQGQATFGHFLEVVSGRSYEVRFALVRALAAPDFRNFIKQLNDAVVVSHFLALLKSTVKADVRLVLDLASLSPVIDQGNATTLSAVLENACHQTNDLDLSRKILHRLLELASIASYRVRNSLRRALPHLDAVLPHREVAKAALKTILASRGWPEKAQEHLVRAASKMDSWSREDTETIIRSDLPELVKAVLLH